MTPPIDSTATQTIATIAFGILATFISIFTAWQGYRTWRKLYRHEGGRSTEVGFESPSFELEGQPLAYNDVFELPATSFSDTPSSTEDESLLPEEARLSNPIAAPNTSAAPQA